MSARRYPPEASWPNVMAAAQRVRNRLKTRTFALASLTDGRRAEVARLVGLTDVGAEDGERAHSLLRAIFDNAADDAFLSAVSAQLKPVVRPEGGQ